MFVGATLGLAAGGLMGFPLAFQVVAVPGFALGMAVLFLKVPPRRAMEPGDDRAPRFSAMLKDGWRALQVPTLRWMLPAGILISFAASGYLAFLLDFTRKYKYLTEAATETLTKRQATIIYAIITLTGGIAGVLIGGIVADRLFRRRKNGRTLTIAIGFFCTIPFGILVILIDRGLMYFVCGWLLLFFIPWYNGPMAAVIDDVVDDRYANQAQAIFVCFLHLVGTGPASIIVGLVSDHSNLKVAFLLPVGALLLAGLCSLMASRHVESDMKARSDRAAAAASALDMRYTVA
jgi:hypothetical protein